MYLSKNLANNLIIENENEITLRVPFDKPLEEIKDIIQKKIQWILKKQDEYRKSQPEIKEHSYLPSSILPYLGNNYTIELRKLHINTNNINNSSFNDNEKVELNDHKLIFYLQAVGNYQDINDETMKNKIKQLYERWLNEQAQIIFKEKINKFSEMVAVSPKDLQIKQLKNRWGSITKNKKIVLNINLIKTPEKIIDYIIIHELCHLKIKGHSHNFWSHLHKFIPDYNERIDWLDRNSRRLISNKFH